MQNPAVLPQGSAICKEVVYLITFARYAYSTYSAKRNMSNALTVLCKNYFKAIFLYLV